MLQRHFHESMAAKFLQFISVAIRSECSLNALGKNAQEPFLFQDPGRTIPARDNSSQFSHEIRQERELKKARMNKETRIPAQFSRNQMKRHDSIPRHEPPVHSNQYSPAASRNMLQPPGFNTPVNVGQEFEEIGSIKIDVFPVHAEFVEDRLRIRRDPAAASFQQCGQAGLGRGESEFFPDFAIRHGPGIPHIIQNFRSLLQAQ